MRCTRATASFCTARKMPAPTACKYSCRNAYWYSLPGWSPFTGGREALLGLWLAERGGHVIEFADEELEEDEEPIGGYVELWRLDQAGDLGQLAA